MRRLLAAVIEALCAPGDSAVTRFANVTDEPWSPADAWDDYGYHPDSPDDGDVQGVA